MRTGALLLSLAFIASAARAANLVPNPSFVSDLGGWHEPVPDFGLAWNAQTGLFWDGSRSVDGSGGSAQLRMPLGLAGVEATICVPVSSAGTYRWSFWALVPADLDRRSSSSAFVALWTGSGCSGTNLGFREADFATTVATPEVWYFVAGPELEVPATIHSAELDLQAFTPFSVGHFGWNVDDVFFGPRDPASPVPVPMTDALGSTLFFLGLAGAGTLFVRRLA